MIPLKAELKTLILNEPFRIAHGVSSERTVLRLHWDGAVGEAPFIPYYDEKPEETLRWLQSQAWQGAPAPASGPRAGRLALDLLWHDHWGKKRGESLRDVWNLENVAPPACRSLSIPTDLGIFAEKVRETHEQFRVLKLKLGSGNVDFDEAIVAKAREVAPQAVLFADVNGGWSVADAARILPRLERFKLEFVEQPVHHAGGLDVWRELRAALPHGSVPLFADESTQNADDVERFSNVVDGVNVKLLKCGTFEEAKLMIRFARANRLKVMLGCMIESSIGVTAAAQLSSLVDWVDLDGHLYVANDDYEGLKYDATGNLEIPKRPGLGVIKKLVMK